MANSQDLRELEKDPRLFLYTSLTAGSSHIITATSRLETILKANRIPFQAIDIATDEQHRKLWQRRAGKRKLPGLVKEGFVLGDLEEVEEWNEYGELKENIGPVPTTGAATAVSAKPSSAAITPASTSNALVKADIDTSKRVALPGAAEMKARIDAKAISAIDNAPTPEKMTSAPIEKEKSIQTSIRFKGDTEKQEEHPSAPPSAIPSAPVTPEPVKQTPAAEAAAAGGASVRDDVGASDSLTNESRSSQAPISEAKETSATATTSPTIIEQLQDTVAKAVSNMSETVTSPKGYTKAARATGDETSSQSAETSPSNHTIVDQVKDSANKVISTATRAVQATTSRESASASATKPGSDAKVKTTPDPAATSEAVESGDIDEAKGASVASSNSNKVTMDKSKDDKAIEAESESSPSSTTKIGVVKPTETAAQDGPTDKAVEGIQNLKVTEDVKSQTQAAADPTEATKSVED